MVNNTHLSLQYVTDTLALYAYKLLLSSAETRLIVMYTERVAKSFNYNNIEVIVGTGIISVSIKYNGKHCTSIKNSSIIGINMNSLIQLTNLCLKAENKEIDFVEFKTRVHNISAVHYNPWLITLVLGISAFAFGYINNASFKACLSGLCAVFIATIFKQQLLKRKFFSFFVMLVTGYLSTILAYLTGYLLGVDESNLALAMVISVLPLVPGYPIVNIVLDLFKGYNAMALTRLISAIVHLISVSTGVFLAFLSFPFEGW